MGVNSNQYLQGINQTTGTGAPVHSAVAGDRYTDTATGITYQYTTSWQTVSYSAGGLTYFTEAQNTTAPNATVPVDSLTAVSATTNADFAILPKGTGAFMVGHIPLNTYDTGGKKGNYAIDIQPGPFSYNGGATGLASVTIGYQNQATGSYAVSLGYQGISSGTNSLWLGGNSGGVGVASGDNSVAIQLQSRATNSASFAIQNGLASGVNAFAGAFSTASGTSSIAMGGASSYGAQATATHSVAIGDSCVSDARSSVAFGSWTSTKGVAQRLSLGSFQDIAPYLKGHAQFSLSSSLATTTTNTATELIAYGGTAINLVLQNNEAIRVKGSIIGKQTASTNVTSYDFDCVIVRGVGAGTTVLKISNMNLVFDDIVCTVLPTLTANTVSGGLSIKSGAKTTTTIKWSCRIDSTEVILA
jgi:hypothetical protein